MHLIFRFKLAHKLLFRLSGFKSSTSLNNSGLVKNNNLIVMHGVVCLSWNRYCTFQDNNDMENLCDLKFLNVFYIDEFMVHVPVTATAGEFCHL